MKKKPQPNRKPPKDKFWDSPSWPIAIAHRGGAGKYVLDRFKKENTIDVFQAAVELGYEYLELDVTDTADDIAIVLHVSTDKFEALLHKPSAPSAKRLEDFTYRELKEHFKREIPTLEEVLKRFPSTKLFIDSKTDAAVELIARDIIKTKAYDRVFLNSFYIDRITKLQKLLKHRVPYGLVIGRYPKLFNRKLRDLMSGKFDDAGLSAVVLPYKTMPFGLIDEVKIGLMHKKGYKVFIWTPNTAAQINRSINLGADGIISDNINLLKDVLKKKKTDV